MKFSRKLFLVLAAVIGPASASAMMWEFTSNLSGLEETPPNASPGTGSATGTYDDVSNLLMIDVMASGVVAPFTAGHIHRAPAGVAGPVVIPLTNTAAGTNWMNHTMVNLTAAQEADFLGGLHYVNLHTSAFPGGEIRGQLRPTPVPEPATMATIALGAAALIRRRRKA